MYSEGNPVGVIGVRDEVRPVVEHMQIVESRRVGPSLLHRGTLNGKKVVAAEIGIGKVAAAAGTQALIDGHAPGALIFTGSAGGLSSALRVGDVAIADRVAVHDVGAYRLKGFVPIGFMVLDEKGTHGYARNLCASPDLVALAARVASDLTWERSPEGHTPQVHIGTVVTGDQLIVSAEKKRWLAETFAAVVVEMEGAAFAQVATAHGIPWLVIRAVSDHADHDFEFALERWLGYVDDGKGLPAAARRMRDRLAYVLSDPGAVLRAGRLLRNLGYAAGNAARLTEALIGAL